MKATLKDLLFHVEKSPVADVLGVETISSTEFGIFGYVNGQDKKPLLINTCSNVYELVPNAEIFPQVEKLLKSSGIDYDVTYRMLDYSRFYADFNIKTGGVSIGNRKDKIMPILRIEHSYNGLLKYKLTFGWFRMICSNGLTVPVEGKEDENFTIVGKHTKQILQSLETLLDKVKYFTKNSGKFTEKFHIIAENWVSDWSNRVEKVIEATGIGKRGYDQISAKIKEESAILYEGKVNDWVIYNAFNYHIYNARTAEGKEYATAPNLRHEQDKKIFDTLYKNPKQIRLKKETV